MAMYSTWAFVEAKDNVRQLTFRVNFCFQKIVLKSVHFGHVHSQLFAPLNARLHGKSLSLSYHATVMFEQLIPFIKGSFSR